MSICNHTLEEAESFLGGRKTDLGGARRTFRGGGARRPNDPLARQVNRHHQRRLVFGSLVLKTTVVSVAFVYHRVHYLLGRLSWCTS